jgi:Alpha/beta hydrolase
VTTFADLAKWDPVPLRSAEETVTRLSRLLAASGSMLDVGRASVSSWSGPASEMAADRKEILLGRLHLLEQTCAAAMAALSSAAEQVSVVSGLVARALATAQAYGLVLTSSGTVLDVAGVGGDVGRLEVEALVAEAQRAALAVETSLSIVFPRLAPASRDAPTGGATPLNMAAWPAVEAPPLPSTDLVSEWPRLSPTERNDLIAQRPDLVGRTEGLPAWARDEANRILLVQADAHLVEQADRLRPPDVTLGDVLGGLGGTLTAGTFGGGTRRVAYQEAMAKLAAVRETERVLAQADGETRQLLLLDVSGRSAKVAISVGDVDRANHVAVVVDGFTTTVQRDLASADGVAVELRNLARREAMGWGDRGEVAVVTWMGYDAPQVADTLRSTHSVVLRGSAEAAARSLADFLKGVPEDRHLTVVAHSYGSTAAGLALASGGTNVDDLVVLGSPGLGVGSTAQLGMPAARVHVLEAQDDPVADLGWFGRDPDKLDGVDLLSTDGGRLANGAAGQRSLGHSQYLALGTTSQWNVAAVIAAAPVRVPRNAAVH